MSKIRTLFNVAMRGARRGVRSGARDERGAVAVFFAVALVLLAPLVIGAIDIYMASNQRSRLQDALDAASLYAARSSATTDADLTTIGRRALMANLTDAEEARLVSSGFTLSNTKVIGSATMASESLASGLWNHGNLVAGSEVIRSSQNIEVALVLDITGSMSGTKITDLKSAASSLVDIVVQDTQTPYYSKMAIVPYSNSVNVGSYAAAVRGAIPGALPITGITRANPGVVTSNNHGFLTGTKVYIKDVAGMTQVNGNVFTATKKTANTFSIGTDTRSSNGYSAYTSGGNAYCIILGCQYYSFTNMDGNSKVYQAQPCVSERTGTHKYDDTAPSSAPVGYVYIDPGSSPENPCPSATITPLSTDKTALKATINGLTIGGSTAGHIGLAWGWYMVSPNFGYLWPAASNRAAAYTAPETLKVVILMTDGAFNTAYCNGVVAKDSGTGSGSSSNHSNCNATNGDSVTQALALCSAIKGQKIALYTVGFAVTSDAQTMLSTCATDASHVYLPASGTALKDAFKAIGQDINSLRLSH